MTVGLLLEVLVFGVILVWLAALVPTAVVTLLKRRYLMFAAGWLTFGIVWMIGAVAPADDPERQQRSARVLLAGSAAVLGAVVLSGLFAARPAPLVGVNAGALGESVGGHLEGRPCRHDDDGTWICGRPDAEFSGSVSYRVSVDRFGCWTGRLEDSRGAGATKRRIEGCLRLEDFVLG